MTLKERVRKEIARGNLEKAIRILLEETDGKMPTIHDEVLVQSRKLGSLQRKVRMGTIDFGEESRENNRITTAILEILSEIDESDRLQPVKPNPRPPTANPNKLEWDEFLRWLNRILAGQVYKTDDIRGIATSFGLPIISMPWDGNAKNHWFNIIDYYVKRDQNGEQKEELQKIIKEVIATYGSSPNLEKALEWAKPQKVQELELKEEEYNAKVDEDVNFEKLMKKGINTLLPIWFLETGIKRGKSVGRVETEDQYGTGLLLKGNYLLTNNHVIKNIEEAKEATVVMNYEKTMSGGDKKKKVYHFDLEAEGNFATSVEDDWTLIKVKDNPNEEWGFIELKESDNVKKGDRVVIIQHPEGDPKQIGLHNNFITFADDNIIMYLTDTMEGSSGSPVFNQKWELVGLHNRGGYLREPTTLAKVWRNGGININKVLKGIRSNNISGF